MKKRILSALVAFSVIIGCCSSSAFAFASPQQANVFQSIVDEVNAQYGQKISITMKPGTAPSITPEEFRERITEIAKQQAEVKAAHADLKGIPVDPAP